MTSIMHGDRSRLRGIRIWAVLFWLIIWQLVSIAVANDILLVSPLQVIQRLGELIFTEFFWYSIFFSLLRIIGGFILAACAGILLAVSAYRFRHIRELLEPVMLAIKSVPVASFIILALIWFSSHNLATLISFLMVLPVIYTNVLDGICSVDNQLLEMAQVFRLPVIRRIRYIYVPQVMPFFRSGCTISLGLCWKSGIAAEVIGMPKGSIGERLQQAKVYLDTPELFAWTLVIVLVSLTFERLFLLLLKKIAGRLERM